MEPEPLADPRDLRPFFVGDRRADVQKEARELLRRLGAAETIDYRETPIEALPQRIDTGRKVGNLVVTL